MFRRLSEICKWDVGLVPQAINNTNVTGRYHHMGQDRNVCAVLLGGAMAAGTTTALEMLRAADEAGTGAEVITGASAVISANVLVTEATIDLTSSANGDRVTINGIEFTRAAATNPANREFANAAGLVTCIADASRGVPGVVGTAGGNIVTVTASPRGERALTITRVNVGGTITLATVAAQAYVEVPTASLGNKPFVAARVTTTANTVAGVLLARYNSRRTRTQRVGASAIL